MSRQHSHPRSKKLTSGAKFLKEKQKSAGAQNRLHVRKRTAGRDVSNQPLPVKAIWILVIFIIIAALAVIYFTI